MWFPVVPEGIIDPAEFRRSASEARSQCRTHAHATATHREHLWIRGALGLVSRLTNLDKLPVSRQLQTESAAAAWTFIWANLLESEAPHIHPPCTHRRNLGDRFASSSSQSETQCQVARRKLVPGAAAPTVTWKWPLRATRLWTLGWRRQTKTVYGRWVSRLCSECSTQPFNQ